MCSKVLNGHIILTDTSITTILAPEMTYTPVIIAGPVVIEDDVVIAGNSFVNRSVPKGAIVAGCPAKIIGWRKNLDYAIETNPKYKDGRMPFLTK